MTDSNHSVSFTGNLQTAEEKKNTFDCLSIHLGFYDFCFSKLQYLMKHANAKEIEVYDE